MNKKHAVVFIVFFLIVIYAVPATQAILELNKSHHVQALDIAEDALVTPMTRANTIHDLLVKTEQQFKQLATELAKGRSATLESPWDSYRAGQIADEALFTIADIKKAAATINRHVQADTATPLFTKLNTVSMFFSGTLNAIHSGASIDSLQRNAPFLQSILTQLINEYPHQNIAHVPVLAVKNSLNIFWNDKYLRPFEKEMENSSVFAQTLRPAMLYSRFLLFNDMGEKAVAGVNNWFFYKPDVDYLVKPYILDKRSVIVDPNDKVVGDNPIAAIAEFKKQLDTFGIDLLVMIVPVKASIYPEMLNSRMNKSMSGRFSHSLRIMDELHKKGIATVDLFSAFAEERMNDAAYGDSLYLQKDTHWRARGLRLAAHVVAERIKQYPWYVAGTTSYTLDSVTIERSGDIGIMTTLPSIKIFDLSMAFAPEKTKCFQVYTMSYDSNTKTTERILYKDDYKHSQILIIGDSFSRIFETDEPRSAGWIAHCAYELSQPVASLVNDGGASTLVRQSLARKASLLKGKKLVVWEVVERDFRYGEEGWKSVPISLTDK